MPVPFQALPDLLIAHDLDAATSHYHNIQALQTGLVVAKTLSYQTLDSIAINRQFEMFLADGQPQAGRALRIGPGKDCQACVPGSDGRLKNSFEITRFQQSLTPGKIAGGPVQAD